MSNSNTAVNTSASKEISETMLDMPPLKKEHSVIHRRSSARGGGATESKDNSQPPNASGAQHSALSERSTAGIMSNFSQQKLRAWQPVLTPRWIVSFFLAFGTLFIVLGILLLLASNGVVECVREYSDPDNVKEGNTLTVTLVPDDCVGPYQASIQPPIFLYYELSNYYQNHRRYVRSRNDEQLRGVVFNNKSHLSSCDPLITGEDGRILSPCGLVARSVFNDSFSLSKNGAAISINEDTAVIAWSSDVQYKYKNPTGASSALINEWLNENIFPGKVENGHFIVWMRSAALPTFRKLYARIDTPLRLPVDVHIQNRYPVASFRGKKRIVLSTTSWLGGRNCFLGIAYLFIGTWCFIFGIFFIVRNYKSPRLLGDVRYLKWVGHREPR